MHIITPIVMPITTSFPACAPKNILEIGTKTAAMTGNKYPRFQNPAPVKSVIKG